MNAFDILERDYKKQFNKVYKANSYQMFYCEAVILLDILQGSHVVYMDAGCYTYYNRFKQILGLIEQN